MLSYGHRNMLSISFTYFFYKRSRIHPRIYDIACKIYHHQNIRKKEQLNCHLDLIYDDSIAVTIEDKCGTHTVLIYTFTDYIIYFIVLILIDSHYGEF